MATLRVSHHGEAAAEADLEQCLLEARRHELRVDLEEERLVAGIGGDPAARQALVQHLVPEVLRGETEGEVGMVGAGRRRHLIEGGSDGVTRRQEHPRALVRGGVEGAEPEGRERADHLAAHLRRAGAVVEPREEVGVQVDVVLHRSRVAGNIADLRTLSTFFTDRRTVGFRDPGSTSLCPARSQRFQ
jgi:hypothetical protein